MIFWAFLGLCLELSAKKNNIKTKVIFILVYYLCVYILSCVSIYYFPINGDEILYYGCGVNYVDLILKGQLWNFPVSACEANQNTFAKIAGYIFTLGGKSIYSIVGFNAFVIHLSSFLIAEIFNFTDLQKEKFKKILIFFPPILYLCIRPGKEASIAFSYCLVVYAVTVKNKYNKLAMMAFALGVRYFIRWQQALVAAIAILLYLLWG
ncbi:MAG: hypothetical protein ACOYOK_13610, partial [Pseudobdellovibrionaceae bacterium]